jgi:hypothetical protein
MHCQFKRNVSDLQCRSSVVDYDADNLIADAQYRFFEALPQPVELGWMDEGWCTGSLSREFVRNFNRAFYTLYYRQDGEWVPCPIDDFTDIEVAKAILEASLDELRRVAPRLRRVYRGYEGDRLRVDASSSNDAPRQEDDLWQMRSRRNRRRRKWDR